MRLRYAVPGALCCLFGLVFVIATAANPMLAVRATTLDRVPGAGFFPYLLGGGCILLGLVLAVRDVVRNNAGLVPEAVEAKGPENNRRLVLCVAAVVAFLAFWKLVGVFVAWAFFPGAFLLCAFLNRLFGRSWKFSIVYAALITVFVHLVFSLGFSIQFVA